MLTLLWLCVCVLIYIYKYIYRNISINNIYWDIYKYINKKKCECVMCRRCTLLVLTCWLVLVTRCWIMKSCHSRPRNTKTTLIPFFILLEMPQPFANIINYITLHYTAHSPFVSWKHSASFPLTADCWPPAWTFINIPHPMLWRATCPFAVAGLELN